MTTPTPLPANKRRRLDHNQASATSILSKPFRSPFKTTTTTPLKTNNNNNNNNNNNLKNTTYSPSSTINSPATSNPQQKLQLLTLTRTINSVRSEIDTIQQALKIESSTKDAELNRLIDKWRRASREAAEVLYADVRERVNRMGGPGVWREMESRKKKGGWWGGDGDGDNGEDRRKRRRGREDGEEGRDEYDYDDEHEGELDDAGEDRDDGHKERSDGEGGGEQEEEQQEDDDVFTIDMMLKTLNVDLNLIGFDKKAQRWID